jgi:hypothetical protein
MFQTFPRSHYLQRSSKSVKFEAGMGTVTCAKSTIEGSLPSSLAKEEESLFAEISQLSFSECALGETSCTPSLINLPYDGSIAWTEAGNGTLNVESGEKGTPGTTFKCGALTCTFTGEPTLVVTGGKVGKATLTAGGAELSVEGSFCGEKGFFSAAYLLNAPAEGEVYVQFSTLPLRICKLSTAPTCAPNTAYTQGTVYEAVLEAETKFIVAINGTPQTVSCYGSTLKAKQQALTIFG